MRTFIDGGSRNGGMRCRATEERRSAGVWCRREIAGGSSEEYFILQSKHIWTVF